MNNRTPYEIVVKVEVYPNDVFGGMSLRLTVPAEALKALGESGLGQLTVAHDDLKDLGFSQIILSTDRVLDLCQGGEGLAPTTGLKVCESTHGEEKHEGLIKATGTSAWVFKYTDTDARKLGKHIGDGST